MFVNIFPWSVIDQQFEALSTVWAKYPTFGERIYANLPIIIWKGEMKNREMIWNVCEKYTRFSAAVQGISKYIINKGGDDLVTLVGL